MSETRATYDVTMQPGRELDALVAKVMHRANVVNHPDLAIYSEAIESARDIPPAYSTVIAVAMEAWAWLEENNPWEGSTLLLGRFDNIESVLPSVYIMGEYWENSLYPYQKVKPHALNNCIISGIDYPHTISLTICEAGKVLGVIE